MATTGRTPWRIGRPGRRAPAAGTGRGDRAGGPRRGPPWGREDAVTLTPELVHEAVRRLTAADGIFAVTEQQLAGVPQRVFTHAAPTVLDILTSGRGDTAADFPG